MKHIARRFPITSCKKIYAAMRQNGTHRNFLIISLLLKFDFALKAFKPAQYKYEIQASG